MIDLKAFRTDNKMTQKDAANYFACTQGFISQIERGDRPVPQSFFDKVVMDNSINAKNMSIETEKIEFDFNEKDDKECISISKDAMLIMKKQAESLLKRDQQIDRLIEIINENIINKKDS